MKKIFFYSLISILMLIFSCQSKTNIGYSILPDDDIINAEIIDTASLDVYTMSMDTIITRGVTELLFGEYIDPIFGYSKASFVSQYVPVGAPLFIGNSIGDSVILTIPLPDDTLNILKYYGNISPSSTFENAQTIKVYRLSEDLSDDSTYFGDQDPSIYMTGDLIGEKSFNFTTNVTEINIALDPNIAQEFIDQVDSVHTQYDLFKEFFKGIYVVSEKENENGAIFKSSVDSRSHITTYSHRFEEDSLIINIPYVIENNSTSVIRFNLYEHDYTGVTFETSIDVEEGLQDSVAYIQGMGGLRAKINLPYLESLKDLGDIIIYRAELVIKTAPTGLSEELIYPAVEKMTLVGSDPESEYYLLPEYNTGTSYLSELYNEGEYRFEIGSYIRSVLDGDIENNGLFLFTTLGNKFFNRSVITTGNHSDRMKLYISYAKL